ATLEVRSQGIDHAQVRVEIAKGEENLLLALVAIGEIARATEAPESPELGLLASSLDELSQAYGALGPNEDPLGLPQGYVEFLYDPQMMSPDRATNFQFVLASHMQELSAALADEHDAESSVRAVDGSVAAMTSALRSLALDTSARLRGICGSSVTAPAEP